MSRLIVRMVLGLTASVCSSWALAQSHPSDFETREFYVNWGLASIRAQYAWSQGFTGAGVRIGIVDMPAQITHPEFAGRAIGAVPDNRFPVPGVPTPMHGTHVMGLAGAARNDVGMMGSAFEAQLLSVVNDELATEGYVGTAAWGAAVIDGAATVMNGSFTVMAQPTRLIDDRINPTWREVNHLVLSPVELQHYTDNIDAMAQQDVVMVFAAGNDRVVANPTSGGEPWLPNQLIATRIPDFPGSLPLITPTNSQAHDPLYRLLLADSDLSNPDTWSYVPLSEYASVDLSSLAGSLIAVVATDQNNQIVAYSNRCGAAADWCLAAPGLDLWSTVPMNTYQKSQGTSMAAPLVAGGAALVRQAFPYMTARQAIEVLLTTATQLGDASIYGHGLLNLERAVQGPIEFGHPSLMPGQASIFAPVFAVDTQGHDSVWRNDIAGVGGFSKAGDGVLALTGNNTYTGATTITGGVLQVDGSIASSALTVGQGGTLRGTGTVGPTVMLGTMAPGHSVGTLTVAGDYEQGADSIYQVEVDANQEVDRVLVQGQAVIHPSASLDLVVEDALYLGSAYEILAATGGITGTFGELETDYPLLSIVNRVQGNSLFFMADRNGVAMASFAQSGNQIAVAQAVDSQRAGDEPFDTVVLQTQTGLLPGLFQSLSGEIYASNQVVLLEQGAKLQQALQWRMQDSLGLVLPGQQVSQVNDRTTAWAQVLGGWDQFDASSNATSVKANSSGFLLGLEHKIQDRSRLGLAFGLTGINTTVASDQATTQGYHLALYGTTAASPWKLSAGAAQSWYSSDVGRPLSDGLGNATGSQHGRATQVFAEVGLPWHQGETTWQPFVNLSQTWLHMGSVQETGSPAALRGEAMTQRFGVSTLGLRWQSTFAQQASRWQFHAMAGWQRRWGDLAPQATLQFAQGNPFTVTSVPLAPNAMAFELGIGADLDASSRLSLTYSGNFGGGDSSQLLQVQLAWLF